MAIADWIGTLKSKMAEVSGVEQVHTYEDMPGSISVFPTMIIQIERGSQSYGMSAPAVAIHRVKMTLYTMGAFLPEGLGQAVPFIKRVRDKLALNMNLDETVAYCMPVPAPEDFYQGPAGISYADNKALLGINFFLVVKEVESLTVSG